MGWEDGGFYGADWVGRIGWGSWLYEDGIELEMQVLILRGRDPAAQPRREVSRLLRGRWVGDAHQEGGRPGRFRLHGGHESGLDPCWRGHIVSISW